MYDFFFDSADAGFIEKTWQQIKDYTSPKHVSGVTTNPKAMDRAGCHTLLEWKSQTLKLCKIVTSIRNDNKGVVYVQLPNCDATITQALAFAKEISTWSDGITQIGMKIPPYKDILSAVPQLEEYVETNVTGVSDAATALFAASYGVRYVSVIPGRMEEAGIDADAHLKQITDSVLGRTEIIAGSMRTLDGLKRAVRLGTVPTIGGTVFGLVSVEPNVLSRYPLDVPHSQEKPITIKTNVDLSCAFFKEMNKLGATAATEFGI